MASHLKNSKLPITTLPGDSTLKIIEFQALLKPVTELVSGMTIDSELEEELNQRFPPGGEMFDAIEKACHEAIADGWKLIDKSGPKGEMMVFEPSLLSVI